MKGYIHAIIAICPFYETTTIFAVNFAASKRLCHFCKHIDSITFIVKKCFFSYLYIKNLCYISLKLKKKMNT